MSGSYTSPNFVIPFVIPSDIPPNLVPIIKPIYIALQNLMQSLIFYGGVAPRNPSMILSSEGDPTAILANNVHRFYIQASEAIAAGAAINLTPVIGVLQVRNANATDGTKPADGFCSQVGGITAGGIGEVILNDGVNFSLTGLIVGSRYFLDTVDGGYTTSAPSASGNLQQSLGIAITTTTLRFWTGPQIQH